MLKVPNLGSISYEDYDLQEMPSPTVARIDDHRFDFKASLRNADFRNHKQYESEEIKEIYPNLYYKKFKVSLFCVNQLLCFKTERTRASPVLERTSKARTTRYQRPTLQA